MKIVVDKLPRGCYFCECFRSFRYRPKLFSKDMEVFTVCKVVGEISDIDFETERHEKCPFISLSEIEGWSDEKL